MPLSIYRSLDEVPGDLGPSVVTIGNFDGVHLGHQAIVRRLVAAARERGAAPSAITFHPHPAEVVAPERAPTPLMTLRERCRLLGECGIEQVLVIPFTREFSCLSGEEFVDRVLVNLMSVCAVLVGANFRFGRGQSCDTRKLASLGERRGFATEVIDAVTVRGRVVSSSQIRRLVAGGEISLANRLLGRPYAMEGEVVSGRGIGSRRTVPTLNIPTGLTVSPAIGVYVTRTSADGRQWRSVTNIGVRPTFGDSESTTVETFLLDELSGDGPSQIRVEFLYRLREERKFPDSDALKAQILRDAGRARLYFERLAQVCH